MTEEQHPFIPGARVAISERYGAGITEGRVEKTYKNGRFTLKGSSQQWRPWKSVSYQGSVSWAAVETGGRWSRRRLDIWDDSTDAKFSERLEVAKAQQRWREISGKLSAIKQPTNALCDAIEAALTIG